MQSDGVAFGVAHHRDVAVFADACFGLQYRATVSRASAASTAQSAQEKYTSVPALPGFMFKRFASGRAGFMVNMHN